MVYFIAEIGTNHVGDINIAKQIIDIAVKCGCNAVKFQKKSVEKIYTKEFLDSPLVSPWGKTQREMRVNREFSEKQFKEIDKYYRDFLEKAKWKRLDIVKLLSCLEDNIDTTNIMADINKRYGDKKYFLQHVREIRNMLESFSYLKENSLK